MLSLFDAMRVTLRSPVREFRTPGSVRGRPGNWPSYRDGAIGSPKMTTTTILTYIGLALTVIALAASLFQWREANRQAQTLSLISDSLSTKYLGAFPDYLPQVSGLLAKATSEILIVSTTPVHGIYSRYDQWLAIRHALETALASTNVKVKCIFSDAAHYSAMLDGQFRTAERDWENWRLDPNEKARIITLFRKYGKEAVKDVSGLEFRDFIETQKKSSEIELETTYKGAEILRIPHNLPLSMWIVDRKEAIFTAATTVPVYFAEAFWTADARLIAALLNISKEYWNSSNYESAKNK